MDIAVYLVPAASALALLFAFVKAAWVNKQDPGDERMVEIGQAIREGAMAFLKAEYTVLAIFVAAVAVLLGVVNFMQFGGSQALVALSFVVGACCSAHQLLDAVGRAAVSGPWQA